VAGLGQGGDAPLDRRDRAAAGISPETKDKEGEACRHQGGVDGRQVDPYTPRRVDLGEGRRNRRKRLHGLRGGRGQPCVPDEGREAALAGDRVGPDGSRPLAMEL